MKASLSRTLPVWLLKRIGTTATFLNHSTNLYLHMTIQNALDYYGTIANAQAGGRAVVLQDKGNNTICKNVEMISYQDTYYSNNEEAQLLL